MSMELRKTALRVYGLSHKDRRWILNALPNRVRSEIVPLLSQLDRMGVPKNQEWLAPFQNSEHVEEITESDNKNISVQLVDMVDSFHLAQIKPVLDNFPDSIIIAILSIHSWSWKEQYLDKTKIRQRTLFRSETKRIGGGISNKVKDNVLLSVIREINPGFVTEIEMQQSFSMPLRNYKALLKKWGNLWQH